MRRTLHRIKKELEYTACSIAGISAAVFLCAMGGILLWVNGGSGWYIMNSFVHRRMPLTVIFLTWLTVYALYGFRLAVRRFSFCDSRRTLLQGAVCLAYILDLVWYALFFCTRLWALALVVIAVSLFLNITVLVRAGKRMFLAGAGDIIVILCELFYAGFTVMYGLLK